MEEATFWSWATGLNVPKVDCDLELFNIGYLLCAL